VVYVCVCVMYLWELLDSIREVRVCAYVCVCDVCVCACVCACVCVCVCVIDVCAYACVYVGGGRSNVGLEADMHTGSCVCDVCDV